MLMVPISREAKIWKQIKYVLCPTGNNTTLEAFGSIIAKSVSSGLISFNALEFFMRDEFINKYLTNPGTILQAMYIGPLKAATVETFATNRSSEFRQQCREILRVAIDAARDPLVFSLRDPVNIAQSHPDRLSYQEFAANTHQLIRDLKGYCGETAIHPGWACAALKKFGHKRYVEKTWKDENFYDLIWTVLAQRPNLKSFVCKLLESQYNDHNAAKFWRRMQPNQMLKNHIQNSNVITEDPLKPTSEFLNFPGTVKAIRMISTNDEIVKLEKTMRTCLKVDKSLTVGLDAEWSAYVSPSRATILQMAMREMVYIIDLESKSISDEHYDRFMTFLFRTEEILKIGFQFGEDLHQLRATFRCCLALYRPLNVICVGRIISDLLDRIDNSPDNEILKKEFLPTLNDEPLKESLADSSLGRNFRFDIPKVDTIQSKFLNKGLSFICEKLLGRPLDKTEQCSVWDRRPLRNLQLRYAAMDAYSMLLLLDKCTEICKRMGLHIEEIMKNQSPIVVSFPLLSEHPL
ncbi:unnamed protein product [Caenorhabditis bovis]|uniref:3'-5' exonuclease domain-containing protein n=1 Tax=Caenorhabditis bovis TaxID=2654633 RepID=A0A8S1EZH7_9PELO|nr:unnamed protein product [Caenorhabditis bovis]